MMSLNGTATLGDYSDGNGSISSIGGMQVVRAGDDSSPICFHELILLTTIWV
jgi:hypothetical protein